MRSVVLLLVVCFLSSCATITRGRDEVISVDSSPSGADAKIMCAGNVFARGTTPARLTIPRKSDLCRVDIEKAGVKTQTIQLERGFNASYWMNFIATGGFPTAVLVSYGDTNGSTTTAAWVGVGLFGAAGFIVDRVTGAMYDHNPSVIKVTLQPE